MVKFKFISTIFYYLKMKAQIVNLEDFAYTYQNGIQVMDVYYEAMKLLNEGAPINQVAQFAKKTKECIIGWKVGKKPRVVSELEKAVSLDVVPLDIDNTKIIPINRLAAKIFWTGNLTVYKNKSIIFGITADEVHLKMLKKYFEENLTPMEMKIYSHSYKENAKPTLTGLSGSNIYSRILRAMGLPDSKEEKRLPKYILAMMEQSQNEKCKELLMDFSHVLFEERFDLNTANNQFKIYLHNQKTEESAYEYSNQVIKLLNTTLPNFGVEKEDIRVYKLNQNNKKYNPINEYCPNITVRVNSLMSLVQNYRSFLKLDKPENQWSE